MNGVWGEQLNSYWPFWLLVNNEIGSSHSAQRDNLTVSQQQATMQNFLSQIEKKAYRMAEIATQNQADALDIVQDAMIKLVENYADKPSEQWKPLFYRILQRRIVDHFRRKKIMSGIFFWKKNSANDDDARFDDPFDEHHASDNLTPDRQLSGERNIDQLMVALKQLPLRQQQCFLLRSWEGLTEAETAQAMGCGAGSVKTHYSRAKAALKNALTEEVY